MAKKPKVITQAQRDRIMGPPVPADLKRGVQDPGKRKCRDPIFSLLFLAAFIGHIVLGFAAYNGRHKYAKVAELKLNCMAYIYTDDFTLGKSYGRELSEIEIPTASPSEIRRLELKLNLNDTYMTDNVWDGLRRHPHIPVSNILMCLVLSVAWIWIMRHCTGLCIYGSILAVLGAIAYLGVEAKKIDDITGQQNYVYFFVFDALILLFVIVSIDKINVSITIMKEACMAIKAHPQMLPTAVIMQFMYIAYLWFFFEGYIYSGNNGKYVVENMPAEIPTHKYYLYTPLNCQYGDNVCCTWRSPQWVILTRYLMQFTMLWFSFFLENLRLFTSAMVTGLWYYEQKVKNPVSRALHLGMTNSFGTVAFGALIGTIMDQLKRQTWSGNPCDCCCFFFNPVRWFICVVYTFVSCVINTITKYCVCMAAITGHSFCASASYSYNTLRRNFHGAYVTDTAATIVMTVFTYIFSIVHGLAMWKMLDSAYGHVTVDGNTLEIWMWVIGVFAFYYPLLGIIILMQVAEYAIGPLKGPCAGVMVGMIARLVYRAQGNMVTGAMDSIFLCYAIDKDLNEVTPERSDLHTCIAKLPEVKKKEEDKKKLLSQEAQV